jgi:hypothetical protein
MSVRASIDALINIYITKPPGSKKLENVTRGVQVFSCLGVRVDAVLIQEVDTPWGCGRVSMNGCKLRYGWALREPSVTMTAARCGKRNYKKI